MVLFFCVCSFILFSFRRDGNCWLVLLSGSSLRTLLYSISVPSTLSVPVPVRGADLSDSSAPRAPCTLLAPCAPRGRNNKHF